jgi:hypothetical protein
VNRLHLKDNENETLFGLPNETNKITLTPPNIIKAIKALATASRIGFF